MRSHGFTLVELLVVSILTVIVAGGLLTAFLTGQTSYFSADAYVQVQQEARRAFDTMVRELREAGPSGGTPRLSVGPVGGVLAGNQLNFRIAMDYDTGTGQITWGDGTVVNNWVHYAIITNNSLSAGNQQQLARCTNGNAAGAVTSSAGCTEWRILANNVVLVPGGSFVIDSEPAPETVTIKLQVRYQSGLLPGGSQSLGSQTAPLTSRVRLRNAT